MSIDEEFNSGGVSGNLMFQQLQQLNTTAVVQTNVLKHLTNVVDSMKNMMAKSLARISDTFSKSIKQMHERIESSFSRLIKDTGVLDVGKVTKGDKPEVGEFGKILGDLFSLPMLKKFGQGMENIFSTIRIGKSIGGMAKKVGKAFSKIMFLGKEKKIGKAAKAMGGMFKNMMGSSLQAWAMEQIMKLIAPLIMILDPIAVMFDIIGGLLSMMVGEALGPFYEGMEPIYTLMLSLAPIFKLVGKFIGVLIRVALIPLGIVFKVLAKVLKPFMPILEPIIDALDDLLDMLDDLDDMIDDALDFFEDLIEGLINIIIDGINLIPGVDIDHVKFARGGAMAEDGMAYLHKNEVVTSSSDVYHDRSIQEDILNTLKIIQTQNEEAAIWG